MIVEDYTEEFNDIQKDYWHVVDLAAEKKT